VVCWPRAAEEQISVRNVRSDEGSARGMMGFYGERRGGHVGIRFSASELRFISMIKYASRERQMERLWEALND
jgi:hypothetical protein